MEFIDNAQSMLKGAAEKTIEVGSEILKSAKDIQTVSGYRVQEIGMPFHFSPFTDPLNRTYQFLLTRMNVVDLYPVRQ